MLCVVCQTPVSGDFLLILNAAKDVVAGDKSWLDKAFFINWSYQIPFVYYEALILKCGSDLVLKLLNVAFMVVTNVLVYFIAKDNEKNAYILSIKDSNLRKQEAKKVILASLGECKNIPLFFWEKTKIMWANMESTTWSLMHIQRSRPVWEKYGDFTYEKVIDNITYYDKSMYIMLYLLIIIDCVILYLTPVSQNHIALFFIALILTNYIAYIFIEVQTRYRYFIMPSFFILTSVAFQAWRQWRCRGKPAIDQENEQSKKKAGDI